MNRQMWWDRAIILNMPPLSNELNVYVLAYAHSWGFGPTILAFVLFYLAALWAAHQSSSLTPVEFRGKKPALKIMSGTNPNPSWVFPIDLLRYVSGPKELFIQASVSESRFVINWYCYLKNLNSFLLNVRCTLEPLILTLLLEAGPVLSELIWLQPTSGKEHFSKLDDSMSDGSGIPGPMAHLFFQFTSAAENNLASFVLSLVLYNDVLCSQVKLTLVLMG